MNVNEVNSSVAAFYHNKIQNKYENNDVNLQVNDSNSTYATVQQKKKLFWIFN